MDINRNHNLYFQAKPIPKQIITKTTSELLSPKVKNVDIYCHSSADEDTINSAKVFGNWLIKNGKRVHFCVPQNEAEKLGFDTKKYCLKKTSKPADKTLVVDFNAKERLSEHYKDLFNKNLPENIIGYDHHTRSNSTLNGKFYIDDTAKSCCGVILRFFQGLGEKLNKNDTKSLYCGMVSDYKKSGLLKTCSKNGEYEVLKTEKLMKDKNSLEVLTNLENKLSTKEKNAIYNHLDPLSRLTTNENKLRKRLFKDIQVTSNGKMAFVIIPPKDKLWEKVGMDTSATSEILKDLRVRISENSQNVEFLSKKQKKQMQNVDTVIAFYQKSKDSNEYRMSIHSKSNSAIKLIKKAQETNPSITAGGHENRAGGKIDSLEENDVNKFINSFIKAAEIL